jgi:geranylgeranyl diphosphate synthase type I
LKSIDNILDIGKKVDPLIFKYLYDKTEPDFQKILKHQIASGGKRVRASLTILSSLAAGGTLNDALPPAAVIELTHNYSLILDDVIDRGDIRRGIPTVRAEFSDAMALLSAMFYREAIDNLIDISKYPNKIRQFTTVTIKELIEGERIDILLEQAGRPFPYINKYRITQLTIDEYLSMIWKKTAALIETACEIGCIVSNSPKKTRVCLKEYGNKIGIAFQVIDDYLDIFGKETGKPKGKDILEHKLGNAVIIFALQNLEGEHRKNLNDLLKKEKLNSGDLEKSLKLILQTDAKEQTFRMGQRFVKEGIKAIGDLKDSEAKDDLISIANFIGKRLY